MEKTPAQPTALSRRTWLGLSAPLFLASVSSAYAAANMDDAIGRHGNADRTETTGESHDVRNYGAKGDGKTDDTRALQTTIDQCHQAGGGTVVVPAGTFLCGSLQLRSQVNLHLSPASKIIGSSEFSRYIPIHGLPEKYGNRVLIFAVDSENITISGSGTIDGNGAAYYTGRGDSTSPGKDPSQGHFSRPHLFLLLRCKRVVVRECHFTASAFHGIRILDCKHIRLEGLTIYNRVNKNNDGIHLQGNEYVHISNCHVQSQDDACALFGSNKIVLITNCSFSTRWSVFRFGGGEPENITISNCLLYEVYGCPIKFNCGPGARMENISFSNLTMRDVTGPISLHCNRTPLPRGGEAVIPGSSGILRNISFTNIHATVVGAVRQHPDIPFPFIYRQGEERQCIVLNGVNETDIIENISFAHVHVRYEGGGTREEGALRSVPKRGGEYYEVGTPPAYGLYARRVRQLRVHDLHVEFSTPDFRPGIVLDQVEGATLHGVTVKGNANAECAIRTRDTQDVFLTAVSVEAEAALFLQVEGATSRDIVVDGAHLRRVRQIVEFREGADQSACSVRTAGPAR